MSEILYDPLYSGPPRDELQSVDQLVLVRPTTYNGPGNAQWMPLNEVAEVYDMEPPQLWANFKDQMRMAQPGCDRVCWSEDLEEMRFEDEGCTPDFARPCYVTEWWAEAIKTLVERADGPVVFHDGSGGRPPGLKFKWK